MFSALVGVLSTGLQERLDQLRRARSRVIEHGHVVVLGWSQGIFSILTELVEPNAHRAKSTIVVLAEARSR